MAPIDALEFTTSQATLDLAVVFCTADRPVSLARTLESLWRQDRLPAELLIVDDGNLDENLVGEIASRCRNQGVVFLYHRKNERGLTRSRNVAARMASSGVLLFLDDDVSFHSGVLAEIAALMSDSRVAAMSPRVLEPTWVDLGSWAFQAAYRIAGWWAIRPPVAARGPRPAILADAGRARPAIHLSGAAMAVRRELIQAIPFDEQLTGYALGEDRDFSYRLSPCHWILEAQRASVVHRREPSGRGDPRQFGRMTARNYVRILRKTCRLRWADYLLIGWTMAVMALFHLALAPMRGRRHALECAGLIAGVFAAIREPVQSEASQPRQQAHPSRDVRPRPLFVTNRLEHGGAEWMMLMLARGLRSAGIHAGVACLKDAGPLADECQSHGVPVHDRLLRHKYDAGVIGRLAELIRRRRYNVLVAVGSGGDRMFWSALAGRTSGVGVVVWSHWCPTPNQTRFERANRALYRFVDRYVALGRRHRDALRWIEHVPSGRLRVIRNGIELPRFDQADQRADARRRLGLRDDQVAIAIVANLRREKRHDVFISAAQRLAPSHPRARFFIIGDGPDAPAVHAALRRASLPAGTIQLLGARPDVPRLLAGLDIVCLCSELECFSLTMLEAAASGCAFIGPHSGSHDEFLVDGVTGLVVRPADVESLSAALDRLLRDASLRVRLADNARKLAWGKFGIDGTMCGFIELFNEVLGARRGRGSPPCIVAPHRSSIR